MKSTAFHVKMKDHLQGIVTLCLIAFRLICFKQGVGTKEHFPPKVHFGNVTWFPNWKCKGILMEIQDLVYS